MTTPDTETLRADLIRRRLAGARRRRQGVPPADRSRPLPLSFGQRRLWLLHQLDPGSPEYLVPMAMRLRGSLDTTAVWRAWDAVAARHEILRTRYQVIGGEPAQIVDEPRPIEVREADLSHLPAAERLPAAMAVFEREARTPIALDREWPLRIWLAKLDDDDHVMVAVYHHIAFDGWSLGVIDAEWPALYLGFALGQQDPAGQLPPLPVQYADYAAWQRTRMSGALLERELAYWHEQLDGVPALELPTDRPRPAVRDWAGGKTEFHVPAEVAERLRQVGRERQATLFMVVLTAFQLLLSRYSGQRDIAIGTPVAGRVLPEISGMIGFTVNTLVIRGRWRGDPGFRELLGRTRSVVLDALDHQELPFERLVEDLRPDRDLSRNPLFQVMFGLHNQESGEGDYGILKAETLLTEGSVAKFDLNLQLEETAEGGLFGVLDYAAALFDPATIEAMAGHFQQLLRGIAADPGRAISALPLTDDEPARLTWDPPAVLVTDLVERQARTRPGAVALTVDGASLTYAELDERANRLAWRLRALGVGPETRVAVCLPRGIALVPALLAVWKAGGAYVPLDPDHPAARLSQTFEDCGARIVITEPALAGAFPNAHVLSPDQLSGSNEHALSSDQPSSPDAHVLFPDQPSGLDAHVLFPDQPSGPDDPQGPPERTTDPDGLAYVIYTSGSTGRPKGVLVTHANLARLLGVTEGEFGFGPEDVWTMFHSAAFDFSVWEMWSSLSTGGRLVVVPFAVSRSPEEFRALLVRERVSVLNQTPSAFAGLAAAHRDPLPAGHPLRLIVFGGERLDAATLPSWPGVEFVNMYGITETTVHVTLHRVGGETPGVSVIGRPLADLSAHVVDCYGDPAPPAVAGELHVGGAGVARGYLGRPALTAERFVPDPYGPPGSRRYRSGDRARSRADGTLEFLGRLDDQIALRGYRVEPAEVEAILTAHPAVHEAAVAARRGRLVAYLTRLPEGGEAELRRHCAAALPAHLVPALYVEVERLPLTPNGKIDRQALPDPGTAATGTPGPRTPPGTHGEARMLAEWTRVLARSPIGVDDDFFELGGDSLRAVALVGDLRAAGFDVAVRDLFELRTIARLARLAADRPAAGEHVRAEPFALLGPEDAALVPDGAVDAYPLSQIQAGMVYQYLANPGAGYYHDVFSFGIRDDRRFDAEALRSAATLITARHENLRTSVELGTFSVPVQIVHAKAEISFGVRDLRHLPPDQRAAEAARWAERERERPVDLSHAPLLRLFAHIEEDLRWRLCMSLHHVIIEGWSQHLLLMELLDTYHSIRDAKPELALSELALPESTLSESTLRDPAQSEFALSEPALSEPASSEFASSRSASSGSALSEPVLSELVLSGFAPSESAPSEPGLPAVRYADFVAAELASLADPADQGFWAKTLDAHARWAVPEDWADQDAGDELDLLGVDLLDAYEGLLRLAAVAGVPLKSVLLAAHLKVLGSFTGDAAFHTGLVCDARPEVAGADRLHGMFLNIVPFPFQLDAPTWRDLVRDVFDREVRLWGHRRFPLPEMQGRWGAGGPLLAAFFNYLDFHMVDGELVDLLDSTGETPNEFPLQVTVRSGTLTLTARRRVIGQSALTRLADTYRRVITAMATDPDGDALFAYLPAQNDPTSAEAPLEASLEASPLPVPLLIAAHAKATPTAVAVTQGGTSSGTSGGTEASTTEGVPLSYGELHDRASRLAGRLRELGAGPERVVGVCLERGPELLVAFLAIWYAGAAYLPLEPSWPRHRRMALLEDADARILLIEGEGQVQGEGPGDVESGGEGEGGGQVQVKGKGGGEGGGERGDHGDQDGGALVVVSPRDGRSTEPVEPVAVDPDSLAYVIYTSGSTGRPKGVEITHRSLSSYLRAADARGSAPLFSSAAYDMAVTSLFAPLTLGHHVRLLPPDLDLARLGDLLLQGGPYDFVKLTPSHLEALTQTLPPAAAEGLARAWLVGGEALTPRLAERWLTVAPGSKIVNEYGPTEATVACTAFTPSAPVPGPRVPIGQALPGASARVLDRWFEPRPEGTPGELMIGGTGVARGYRARPALTAERFVPDPYGPPGSRMYRSGDLARVLPSGDLDLLGRLDDQVKIRGYRVEPGEVAAALAEDPQVAEAVVVATGDRLIGYIVPAKDRPADHAVPARDQLVDHALSAGNGLVDHTVSAGDRAVGHAASAGDRFDDHPRSGGDQPEAHAVPAGEFDESACLARLRERLPGHLVPWRVVRVEAVPLTANGKLDRKALPDPAGPSPRASEPPATPAELELAQIWAEILGVATIGRDDDFFDLGGHSLLMLRAVALAGRRGLALRTHDILELRTIRALAARLESPHPEPSLIWLRERDTDLPPIYAVHPAGGASHWYRPVAERLSRPVAAFAVPGPEEAADLQRLAGRYVRLLGPAPHHLLAWSSGSVIAWEMAAQLIAAGHPPPELTLLDPMADIPGSAVGADTFDQLESLLRDPGRTRLGRRVADLRARRMLADLGILAAREDLGALSAQIELWRALDEATAAYRFPALPLRVRLVASDDCAGGNHTVTGRRPYQDYLGRWRELAGGGLSVHRLGCAHRGVFDPPYVDTLVQLLRSSEVTPHAART
ncbi:amino acid adenylation domain-containing protein [Acrocarpospora sp. B8E8]|uniref:amino acid adenylation domain-containing protein n=1 Tax=Acrocarpospora sp. B8E8 TaxID=3153572 RepID=UPI00325D2DB9